MILGKLVSFNEVLTRLRYGNKPVPRSTVMNWIDRGHLTDMRPPSGRGRRMPIFLDEDTLMTFISGKGYTWLPPGQRHAKDQMTLMQEDIERLAAAIHQYEQQVLNDRERIARLRSSIPSRSATTTMYSRASYATPLEKALATSPSAGSQLNRQPQLSEAEPKSQVIPSQPRTPDEYPRWTSYNPSEEQIAYNAFWVGRGRVPKEYLGVFVPCVRAHGITKNTGGSMRASWLARRERGLSQRFQVTYIDPAGGKDGQMLLTREDAIQVIQRLQKEARDKKGNWDETTFCTDPLCPVCPSFDWVAGNAEANSGITAISEDFNTTANEGLKQLSIHESDNNQASE